MVMMAFFSIGLLTFCQNVHTLLELVASCCLLVIFEVALYKVVVSARCYFWFYINDLMDSFNADVNCKLYADDVKLYTEVGSAGDLFCFRGYLDSLHHWSLVWQRYQFHVLSVVLLI